MKFINTSKLLFFAIWNAVVCFSFIYVIAAVISNIATMNNRSRLELLKYLD